MFPLSGPLDAPQHRAIAAAAKADSLDLQLPGVRVFAHRATARLDGNRVRIELLP